MTTDDVEKIINEHVDLITVDARGLAEAKTRASKFLVATSMLAAFLKDLEVEIAKFKTIAEASKAQAVKNSTSKNITEKKFDAELDQQYQKSRENYESLDSQRDWIRNYIRIFENAHLMYRQYSRD